jgi:hypothetical protein
LIGTCKPQQLSIQHALSETVVVLVGLSSLISDPVYALPMSYAGSTTVMVDIDPHWSTLSATKALDRRNGIGASVQYIPKLQGHNSHSSTSAGEGSHAMQGNETFILVDATRLVHRWNLPNAQANLWLFAGLGIYGSSGVSELVTIPNPDASANQPDTPNPTPPSPGPHPHQHLLKPVASTSFSSTTTNNQSSNSAVSPYLQFMAETPSSLRFAVRPGIQFDAETTRLRFEAKALLFLASGIERPLFSATAGAALTEATYTGFQPWIEFQARSMPGVVDQLELTPKLRLVHNRIVLEVGYSNLGTVVGGLSYTF